MDTVYFYSWPTESTEGAGETEVVPSLAEELGKLWSLVEKGALASSIRSWSSIVVSVSDRRSRSTDIWLSGPFD